MKDVGELGACTSDIRKSHDTYKKTPHGKSASSEACGAIVQPTDMGAQNFMGALAHLLAGPVMSQLLSASSAAPHPEASPEGLSALADKNRVSQPAVVARVEPEPPAPVPDVEPDDEPTTLAPEKINLDADEELLRQALKRAPRPYKRGVKKRPAGVKSVMKRPASVHYDKHPPVPTRDAQNPMVTPRTRCIGASRNLQSL